MQPINIPVIGNSWFVGLVALIHILLVSIAGTAPLVAYILESWGLRKGDIHYGRLAKALVVITLEIGVIGGILGSGTVVVLIGLFPQALLMVVNIFFWFLVLQLACYIAGLAFLFAYYYTWEGGRGHRWWGLLAAILPILVMVVFSAGTAFANNPGTWPSTGNILEAVFNPMTIPSLLHRLVAGLSLTGFFVVVVALWGAWRAATEEDRGFYGFVASVGGRWAVVTTALQVVPGTLVIFFLPAESAKLLMSDYLIPWLVSLVLGVAALALIFFFTRRPRLDRTASWALTLGVVLIVLTTGLMGITRSLVRGPDQMFGVMDAKGGFKQVPPAYQPATGGKAVLDKYCGSCHPGLAGDAVMLSRTRHPDPANLVVFLKDPAASKVSMPPFAGTDADLKALVAYLLDVPENQVPVETTSDTSSSVPALGDYVALAWNDLGMHCFMADYSIFQILVPYNTFDGWDLSPGVGLKGQRVADIMKAESDH